MCQLAGIHIGEQRFAPAIPDHDGPTSDVMTSTHSRDSEAKAGGPRLGRDGGGVWPANADEGSTGRAADRRKMYPSLLSVDALEGAGVLEVLPAGLSALGLATAMAAVVRTAMSNYVSAKPRVSSAVRREAASLEPCATDVPLAHPAAVRAATPCLWSSSLAI